MQYIKLPGGPEIGTVHQTTTTVSLACRKIPGEPQPVAQADGSIKEAVEQQVPPDTWCVHCTKVHCSEVHCTKVHCTKLHCTKVHCSEVHCTKVHCIEVVHFLYWDWLQSNIIVVVQLNKAG